MRGLRRYSSYLTPSRGFASLDTWAGITLWLRNTLINWFVFLPVFGALAGLPILYAAATYAVAGASGRRFDGVAAHVGYAGALALFIAVLGSIVALPSHTHPTTGRTGARPTASSAARRSSASCCRCCSGACSPPPR